MNRATTIGDEPRSLRRRALEKAQVGLSCVGATQLYVRLGLSHALPIIAYHSVADEAAARWIMPSNRVAPRLFDEQMRWLSRHRRVIGIETLLNEIKERGRPESSAVLLTFDDGYRDFYEVAAPILRKYGLPATAYWCTGYVGRLENHWPDVLYSTFQHRQRERLDWIERCYDLRNPVERRAALMTVHDRLLAADYASRSEWLGEIVERLKPDVRPPRLTISWDEIRELDERHANIAQGLHTVDHIDLSSLSREAAFAEVEQGAVQFESELGRRPRHFSYPYARAATGLAEKLKEAGLLSAMGRMGVTDDRALDVMDLKRLDAPESLRRLGYLTSGAHPDLSRRLFGRA